MKRTTLLTVVLTIMFAASCTLGGLDTAQIAQELSPSVAVLSAMEAAMALPVDPAVASRALNPSAPEVAINAMPATVYTTENLATGNAIIRLPRATGTYYDNYYTNGTQAYLEMQKETTDIYRVWLHLFPRLDMTTSEVIEEYLVYESKSGIDLDGKHYWGYYNESGQANNWISQKTILRDGTIANRNTMWTSDIDSSDLFYEHFLVPEFAAINDSYLYPDTLPLPKMTNVADYSWSSKTTSSYTADTGGVRMDIVEYYTETATIPDPRTTIKSSGVQYFVKGKKNAKSTKDWGVTRSTTDLVSGAKEIRTLVTTGDNTSKWFTSAQEISVSETADNLLTYNAVYKESWVGPDIFSVVAPELETRIKLTETGVDTYIFSGTYETFTDSSLNGTTATLSYAPSASGYTMTVGSSVPRTGTRSLLDGNSTFTLKQSSGSYELTFTTANGSFTGKFVQGYLIGTFTSGRKSVEAEISRESITVGGTEYSQQDYLTELP